MFWSGTGTLVAITTDDSFYVLRFDRDAYLAKLEEGGDFSDEGVEEAFKLVTEVSDRYVVHAHSVVVCSLLVQCPNCKVDRRLLHLYHSGQPTELLCRHRVVHHHTI